jgi:hypothetical protein
MARMSASTGSCLIVVAGFWNTSCGRTALDDTQARDADRDAGPDVTLRVPLRHRPVEVVCQVPRGPGPFTCLCPSADGASCTCPGDECGRDSDCPADRRNGRCLALGPLPTAKCSYDDCMTDTDCPASVPCNCRPSPSLASALPNTCLAGSDCRVDSDCGAGGYCSPSQFGQWCGFTYHCHTMGDTCIDDSDCAGVGCNFDKEMGHWACGGDCGPAPA